MNRRLLFLIGFAFLISGGTSVLLYKVVVPRMSTKASQPPPRVAVAVRNLEPGSLLRETDVRMEPYRGKMLDQLARTPGDVAGRGVMEPIFAGEPVHEGRLAPKGAGAGLAVLIPKGMRAVAVRVNDVMGVAGFVLPGMRVDVVISGRPPHVNTQQTGTVSRTLLQNVQVLSAGQRLHKDADGKPLQTPVVNLLVTPAQAEMLSLAGSETRIQLVLRNPMDIERADPPGTAVAKLFGGAAEPPPTRIIAARRAPEVHRIPPPPNREPARREQFVMEVLHGARRTESRF
jgi:pilus assembly protein CpaB